MADINWKGIDLNLLVAFQALYKARSVSLAANELHISQSAMSHSLARLRQMLGDPLFHRQGHKMEPTEKAMQLARDVDLVIGVVTNNILSQESFAPEKYQEAFKIGLTDYAEFVFAPQIFDRLSAEAPNAKISFINVNRHNVLEVMEKERLDLAIGSFPSLPDRYQTQPLYQESHVCLFDANKTGLTPPLSIEQFCQLPHALVSPDGNWVTNVDKSLQEQDKSRHVQVLSRNFLTIGQLIKGRDLVCIVPKLMSMIPFIAEGLTRSQPPIPVSDFTISMLWRSNPSNKDKQHWLQGCVASVINPDFSTKD
ncbi:lysR-like transcriptional regulator [Vibrio ishigakensis]|uniref:LysR-like transcriptional regulator n=1 Tax=Vibrio ishigakensis TaxID=1481914 RepID=A0A0B8NSR0_9VIBR|nr:LysR family transcriptional regulator [Vibrio ishigakensis]GAM57580.1 lysR-like transcriptional regulator [Vibrio ishigakensis]